MPKGKATKKATKKKATPPKITDIFFGAAMKAKINELNRRFVKNEAAILSVEFTGQDKAHTELKKQYHAAMVELISKAPLKVEEVAEKEQTKSLEDLK